MRLASSVSWVQPEVEHDGFDELSRVEHGVDQARHRCVPIETAQHGLQKCRLAAADLARNDDESSVSLDTVAQVAERFAVYPARVQIVGIGTEREWSLAEVEETFIHGGFSRMRRSGHRA